MESDSGLNIERGFGLTPGKDFIGVGIGAAIVNQEGKLLLAQRGSQAKNEQGLWETPGGGQELGDTMQETLKREMMEELNIEIGIGEVLGTYDHILPEVGQHWVAVSFICKITNGEPTIMEPEKCSQIGWFTLDEAEKLPLSFLGKSDITSLRSRCNGDLASLFNHIT